MKSVKGRKEGKDEINRVASRPVKMGKKEVKSQSLRTGVVLKNCVSESKQKRKEK